MRIETGEAPLYKIGITNRSVEERFSRDLAKIKIIETWEYPFGIEALERETEIRLGTALTFFMACVASVTLQCLLILWASRLGRIAPRRTERSVSRS